MPDLGFGGCFYSALDLPAVDGGLGAVERRYHVLTSILLVRSTKVLRWMTDRSGGNLFTTIASVLWGTVFVAIGVGLKYTNPYNLVFLRFLTASIFALAFAFIFGKLRSLVVELRRGSTWVLGGIYALGFLLQYVGQSLTDASEATLLSNFGPTLVPIVALLLLRDTITTAQRGATVLGLSGFLLIISPKFTLGSGYLGGFILFAASLTYALFTVLSKRLGALSTGSAFSIMISVTVFLTPVSVVLGGFNPLDLRLGSEGWLSVIYLGVVCTGVAIALYLEGLSAISASQSATLLLVELLTGLWLAATFLGESLNLPEITGTAAILAAMGLSALDGRSRELMLTVSAATKQLFLQNRR